MRAPRSVQTKLIYRDFENTGGRIRTVDAEMRKAEDRSLSAREVVAVDGVSERI